MGANSRDVNKLMGADKETSVYTYGPNFQHSASRKIHMYLDA